MFLEKPGQATHNNFVPVKHSISSTRVKSKAAATCKNTELIKLAKDTSDCKCHALDAFSVKTHQQNFPFCAIVSEKGSWQHLLSQHLLRNLNCLEVADPFATKSSNGVAGC